MPRVHTWFLINLRVWNVKIDWLNISQTVRDREFISTEGHYKVPHWLPKTVEIFDLRWPWKVKVTNRNLRCGIIRKRYEDREFVSREGHYKIPYRFPKKVEIFDHRWPWKVKVTNWNLRCGISRKRYEIESSFQQKVIIKSHIGFPKKAKYLTFGDPERSRSLTEILDA